MRFYLPLIAAFTIAGMVESAPAAEFHQTFFRDGVLTCESGVSPAHAPGMGGEHGAPVPSAVASPSFPKHQNRASLRGGVRATPLGEATAFSSPSGVMVPADFISPVELVRDVGHLRHQTRIDIPDGEGMSQLVNVLSFTAPQWARYVLIEFEPDPDSGAAGMYVRSGRPFQGGSWPVESFGTTGLRPNWGELGPMQRTAYPQADFRSDSRNQAFAHYILLSERTDPAPAGRLWSVAVGQIQSDRPVSGTLRVLASGSNYVPPLAVELFFDQDEQDAGVGFFDPTPRIPDGDNPGATYGEALTWAFLRATEHLLDALDFTAPYPVRIVVSSTDDPQVPAGTAWSGSGARVDQAKAPPGRLRARPGAYIVPMPVWEREAGTDACRAWPANAVGGACPIHLLEGPAGRYSGATGRIQIKRDHTAVGGADFRWDLNFHERGSQPNIINLIQHELLHVLGFSGPDKSQAYVATFDPPRRLWDAPASAWEPDSQYHGIWTLTESRQHHYGPVAGMSPDNPWADTAEPGPRLADYRLTNTAHLSGFEANDDLGGWPELQLMRLSQTDAPRGPGIAREILLDVGYAVGVRAVRDRLLPRHMSDSERSGHGVDLRRVERADGSFQHFLYFYTYDAGGRPEWYLAVAEPTADYRLSGELEYVAISADGLAAVDPSRSGTFALDLDPSLDHPACAGRTEYGIDGSDQWGFAVFDWELAGESGSWCLQPVQFGDQPAWPVEASGSWYAADPDDSGWGLTVVTRNYAARPIINAIVYHYDQAGLPTWSWGVAGGDYMEPYGAVRDGVTIQMEQFDGFCRTCPAAIESNPAGSLEIRFPSDGLGIIDSLSVDGPAGRWQRSDVELRLLSSPHPRMFQ